MALEVYTNDGLGTVTNGGTTGPPAAGTVETWTVTSTNAFPVASASATPPTSFYIADLAIGAETEKILVTVAPGGTGAGQTWTVTRGADGTTPVLHSSNFIIGQALTRADLKILQQTLGNSFNVYTQFGADPTGATFSDTAFANVVTAVGAGNAVVYVPYVPGVGGTYKIANTWLWSLLSQQVVLWLDAGVTIQYTGSADAIRMLCTVSGAPASARGSGIIGDGLIDMTNAGAGTAGAPASGLHIGDIFQALIYVKVINSNAGAGLPSAGGSVGVHFDNTISWTEQMTGRIAHKGCTNGVCFDVNDGPAGPNNKTSTGSFARPNLAILCETTGGVTRNGVVLQNGAGPYDGDISIRGNFPGGTTGSPGAVLTITGTVPTGHPNAGNSSKIFDCALHIGAETTTSGNTVFPVTITFGAAGNLIRNCHGVLSFDNFGGAQQFTSSNVKSIGAGFRFDGPIIGDSALVRTYFTGTNAIGAVATGGTINPNQGSNCSVTPTASITGVIISAAAEDGQVLSIVNTSAFSIAFAASGTSNVAAGVGSTIPANSSQTYIWNAGAALWYGQIGNTYLGVFGDGSDGSVTFDGSTTILGMVPSASTYTMTRDIFCTSITINAAVTVVPHGFRIFCRGVVTNNGTISDNGNAASGTNNGTGGAITGSGAFSSGRVGANGAVGAGSAPASASSQIGTGGAGGAGGTAGGTAGGGVGATAGSIANTVALMHTPVPALCGVMFFGGITSQFGITGGSSGAGDGTNVGGGGGGGGGVIAILAYAVINNGTISATGGAGGSPTTAAANLGVGGGGGGSGGLIYVATLAAWTAGTTTVTGGTGGTGRNGTGGTGAGNGGNGTAGQVLNEVLA